MRYRKGRKPDTTKKKRERKIKSKRERLKRTMLKKEKNSRYYFAVRNIVKILLTILFNERKGNSD